VAGLAVAALLLVPAGLAFWAIWRSSKLTERLHPLTPQQRAVKRKIYAVVMAIAVTVVAVEVALGRSGVVFVVAVLGGILLLDAVFTPWLHYRRAHRGRGGNR